MVSSLSTCNGDAAKIHPLLSESIRETLDNESSLDDYFGTVWITARLDDEQGKLETGD